MKVVILAGGFGTRISEESHLRPKPMIEIGEKPILWHIMKIYSYYGFNEFIICLGYKSHMIKEFFADYYLHTSDVTIDLAENKIEIHDNYSEPWKITLVETGLNSMTGHRVKLIEKYIDDDEFMLTYGDGVSDVDVNELLEHHHKSGKLATLTAVKPKGRFGSISLSSDDSVTEFIEKPKGDQTWVNGGFFVLNRKIFDYIDNNTQNVWETDVLAKLATDNELSAYKHNGFWQCMDTLREKEYLNEILLEGNAPWLKEGADNE